MEGACVSTTQVKSSEPRLGHAFRNLAGHTSLSLCCPDVGEIITGLRVRRVKSTSEDQERIPERTERTAFRCAARTHTHTHTHPSVSHPDSSNPTPPSEPLWVVTARVAHGAPIACPLPFLLHVCAAALLYPCRAFRDARVSPASKPVHRCPGFSAHALPRTDSSSRFRRQAPLQMGLR